MLSDVKSESDAWSELKEQIQADLEQSRRELKEIALMLEQSQLEVNKLAQRNASITSHLQQVQGQFDTLPRADIRMAYDSALDAQQRLFVMRGQLEKLQSDRAHLTRFISVMEKVLTVMEGGDAGNGGAGGSSTAHAFEMMIQAQESERQRLSRQMHDGPAQALSNFILQTEIAMRLFDLDQQKAREELENLKISATTTFRKVRDFIFELRPMMLDDLGLVPTLKRYVDAWKEQSGIDARLMVTGKERRLESYEEVMIFRAIQELLNNVGRHSNASSVKVQIDLGEGLVKVTVDDDGKGFDPRTLDEKGGMGLKVIRDRVDMLGGVMDVDSVVGQGTRVTFQLPILEPTQAL
ncbi:MAG: histidine kinase [Anaerolineales bacterium]|jgi:two-component system sensor histidine kinase DegS|nr:histidine kinase [Anaerolineales bacterium]